MSQEGLKMLQPDFGTLEEDLEVSKLDTLQCIDHLRRSGDNIGIQHYVIQRLYGMNYDELEFYIPQFIQLLVSFETESMALEDFLLDYCGKYPHFSLIVFWNLQAFIFELRNDSELYSFQTVRKFVNKLQGIMFNSDIVYNRVQEFRENLHPALILGGAIAASIAAPRINNYVAPLIKSQGRQQKSFVFKLANYQKALTRNLTMKNQRLSSDATMSYNSDDEGRPQDSNIIRSKSLDTQRRISSLSKSISKRVALVSLSDDSEANTTDEDIEVKSDSKVREKLASLELDRADQSAYLKELEDLQDLKINTVIKSKKQLRKRTNSEVQAPKSDKYNLNSHSMPDLLTGDKSRPSLHITESEYAIGQSPRRNLSQHSQLARATSYSHLLKLLQVNYAKKETEFIMALLNVSLRLALVPKQARLSALRAELSIINETLLPSEIDIPQLLPITSNKNKKYHKILRLNVNEACVLNSAERVPFLLSIEYLSDELDFNPFSEYNQKIISKGVQSGGIRSQIPTADSMDISDNDLKSADSDRYSVENNEDYVGSNSQIEADISEMPILSQRSSSSDLKRMKSFEINDKGIIGATLEERRDSPTLGANLASENSTKTLADRMRIASVMLQQLESSGRSTSEHSIAIKNRIVDSMISLQDQFDSMTFETLTQLTGDKQDAGERKLENDFKLGEDWKTKKMRIRNSSVYGHLQNWDLCSVIAKNGDDLPQEAFACQLITLIFNIWKKYDVKAWIKRMKILITSANTGLVETITNAMSIHSIKKSLTEISIAGRENSKGNIFSLQDYFMKIYGSPTSAKYKQAQENFAVSLASYSIICYVLQVKDRHNGNIMLDNEGHIIHIDFGFLLSNSPGSVGFEASPFKLTMEYVDLMGGFESPTYLRFKNLCKDCFKALRKDSDEIIDLVELMQKDSNLPCFKSGENTSVLLRQRLQLQLTDEEVDQFVESFLIGKSLGSMYTRLYDQFQMLTQGIYN
ncbi:uncharacterized protein PRCAT00006007001 [Priceomyces carsonii]|uniref:uncharacterized protein n=1 Tax=Priceomyces carsonii TaxID=28549 RepID=UPI002EDB5118|nr:unnamed protein product [Priceomyces carsonii]